MGGSACTSCGYDLSGVASATCPECGYTPTAEEVALRERRVVFTELVRWRQWGTYAWMFAPFLLMFLHRDLEMHAFIGVIFVLSLVAWAESAGRASLRSPAGQRIAARAVWRLSTKWLIMPLWAAGAAVILLAVLSETMPWSLREKFEWAMLRAPVVVGAAAFSGAWPAWRWSWRRLSRTAGLTADLRDGLIARKAARKVMWAMGVLLALPVLALILEFLLDLLNPQWWI